MKLYPIKLEEKQLREFEVWMEGYSATGESSGATFVGKCIARSFAQACHILFCRQFLEYTDEINKPDSKEYFEDRWDYNPDRLTYWGCKLFDNETEARKSFG